MMMMMLQEEDRRRHHTSGVEEHGGGTWGKWIHNNQPYETRACSGAGVASANAPKTPIDSWGQFSREVEFKFFLLGHLAKSMNFTHIQQSTTWGI